MEDEPLVALDMVAGLEQRGAEIMGSVDNTLVALALIKNTRLDPARLDANLGGRPVDDIAAALTRQHVQLVFVTGYGQEILPQAFAVAPMLSKPFSQRQLLDAAGIVQRPADGITLRN